jgi:hypothetical protein
MDKNTVKLSASAADKRLIVQHGFESGYATSYSRIKATSFKNGKMTFVKGVSTVSSVIFNFKDSSGASWAFGYGKSEIAKSYKLLKGMHFQSKAFSGLGDTGLQVTSSLKISASLGTINTDTFIWRRGSYMAEVNIGGYGSVPSSQALPLAKLVDSRIDHFG